jgi:hypothetical protein
VEVICYLVKSSGPSAVQMPYSDGDLVLGEKQLGLAENTIIH